MRVCGQCVRACEECVREHLALCIAHIVAELASPAPALDMAEAAVSGLGFKPRSSTLLCNPCCRYHIATLEEFLDVVEAAPRVVGIYPEVKSPSYHNALPQVGK